MLLLSQDCTILTLICSLWCWVLGKDYQVPFLSLMYESTWDWTIGKHSTQKGPVQYMLILDIIYNSPNKNNYIDSTVTKGLVQELEDFEIIIQVETVQNIVLVRSVKYWEISGSLEETCHSNSRKKTSRNTDEKKKKNSQGIIIIMSCR